MTKKICSASNANSHVDIMGYTYPVYHETKKSSYVDFKAYDPATGQNRRKKYHLENIKSKRERKIHANELIAKLVRKLSTGWSPWADVKGFRGYTDIHEVLDRYLESVKATSRQKTIHSYSSRVNIFREFLKSLPVPVKYVYQYDTQLVNEFLDYIVIDRDAKPRTRNNYKGWCSALGEFMVQRKYIESNPAAGIHKVREEEKKRKPLSAAMLREVHDYLDKADRYFLLAVMMEYYTFIRPTELTHLRIKDFQIKKQIVHISASFSKNKRDGYVGLNENIIRLMLELKIFDSPGDYYVFGKQFKPGKEKSKSDIFNKRWVIMRKALHYGPEYQFYSLKDSGIRDLANDKGIVIARDQARHTDISTTNKYIGHEAGVREETKTFLGNFAIYPDDKTRP